MASLLVLALAGGCRPRQRQPETHSVAPLSFHADVEPVLTRFCASSEGCHGDHATRSATLDLRSGHAHHDLVAVAAKTRAGARLVVPGDPDRSYLLDKLRGALATGEGKSMPLDPETGAPLDISPLPAGFIDRVLEIWIVQGAPND